MPSRKTDRAGSLKSPIDRRHAPGSHPRDRDASSAGGPRCKAYWSKTVGPGREAIELLQQPNVVWCAADELVELPGQPLQPTIAGVPASKRTGGFWPLIGSRRCVYLRCLVPSAQGQSSCWCTLVDRFRAIILKRP
jgi:hypothetical protein